MNAKPISESSKSTLGQTGCVVAFGLVFFLAGMFMLVSSLVMPWLWSLWSSDWQQVPCQVISSAVQRHRGEDNDSFSVEISYTYAFDQQNFTSDLYEFNLVSPSQRKCEQIVALYPAGQQAVCFVDPDDPENAVLNRDFRMSWMMLIMGTIFSAVGAAVAIGVPLTMARRKVLKKTVDAPLGSRQSVDGDSTGLYPEDVKDQKWDVPQKLKPTSTRIGQLLGVIGVALFWNGIFGALLFSILPDIKVDVVSIFVVLFAIPFVLIGLLIILGVIRSFLSLFNPVFEIAMSTGAIGRGNSVDVAWEIKGNAKRIKRLRIAAVGTETANYMQGTSKVRTTSDFGIIQIQDSSKTEEITFGSQCVTIPLDAMHTFEDRNNQVTWAIHVKAEIRRFPDVFQKHIFRVKP